MSSVQAAVKRETSVIGLPLKRAEDPKFITGTAHYTDDVVLPNMLYGVFVRSLYAHAQVKGIDVSEAVVQPGVRLVLTGDDLAGQVNKMPTMEGWGEAAKATDRPALATKEVNFAGEAVAFVVADDPLLAEDAAELVHVEYEPLPAVVDPAAAAEPSSPKVHDYLKDNIGFRSSKSFGNVAKAFKEADHIVKFEHEFPRLSAVPMEPRTMVASFEQAASFLTVWLSSQAPHDAREDLASVLNLQINKVRVISPDTGGGFGQKGPFYPEYPVIGFASMRLGRPVKWVEGRGENLIASSHGRGQKQFVEAAVRRDGRILGMKVRVIVDGGAYSYWMFTTASTTAGMGTGVYDIGAYQADAITVFTNKPPVAPYRGAGRPEGTFLIERTIDIMARRLKLDPVKVRRKNYIPRRKFPYKTAGGNTYDSGNYEMNLEKALEYSKYEQLKAFQRDARAKGRLVGIGLINYVEICAFGPGAPQTASISVSADGSVTVIVGTNPQGQGHWTPFAQIVAEELGVDVSDVTVLYGDTNAIPYGTVTAGSRSAAVGGTAVLLAARRVREKMSKIAAKTLGLKSDRMHFRDGRVIPVSSPSKGISFAEVADKAYTSKELPPGLEPTLFEYAAFAPQGMTFPFGTHVAMVEVDRRTGFIKILKYVAVDDVGRVLNPLIVDGQVQGGVLQGISQALLERMVYDENGQVLTATLSDYLIPSTESAPMIETYRTETPTPLNPLGVKGVGEAGTIAATPAVVGAVEDALSQFGCEILRLPLTPEYVHSLMKSGAA